MVLDNSVKRQIVKRLGSRNPQAAESLAQDIIATHTNRKLKGSKIPKEDRAVMARALAKHKINTITKTVKTRINAATTIQRVWRGHKARRELTKQGIKIFHAPIAKPLPIRQSSN